MKSLLSEFIDIHLHILPGLDDGPGTMQESLAMARCYQQAGVRKVVATPHFLPGTVWSASRERISDSVAELQKVLDNECIDVTVLPGMEIGFHRKLAERLSANELLSLGNSGFYLIEPPFQGKRDEMIATLEQLLQDGFKLILAHPERIIYFQEKPDILTGLVHSGLQLQVNSGSLLGYHGSEAKQMAEALCQWGVIDYLASDAHDPVKRKPLSRNEWDLLGSISGGEDTLKSCIKNLDTLFRDSNE